MRSRKQPAAPGGRKHVSRDATLGETGARGGGWGKAANRGLDREETLRSEEGRDGVERGDREREGCVPSAREMCKESGTVPRPRPLTGQVPARTTRQRRNDRSSDISLAPEHTSGGRRSGEATGLRRGGGAKLLHLNAISEGSATC